MGQKGGGRKGFVKAAAATKQPDAPPTAAAVSDDASPALQQSYGQAGKEDRAQPDNGLSLPEAAPVDNETRGQMLQRHKKVGYVVQHNMLLLISSWTLWLKIHSLTGDTPSEGRCQKGWQETQGQLPVT